MVHVNYYVLKALLIMLIPVYVKSLYAKKGILRTKQVNVKR